MTLEQALKDRGMTYRKEHDPQRNAIYAADGTRLGEFTAQEGWQMLAGVPFDPQMSECEAWRIIQERDNAAI